MTLTAKGQKERGEAARAVSGVEQRVKRKLGPAKYEALKNTLAAIIG